jgi:hypothetical protein
VKKFVSLGEDLEGYVATLRYDEDAEGRVFFVKWVLIHHVAGSYELDNGKFTTDPDDAPDIAHGFCKWDGCAEVHVNEHVCGAHHLNELFRAVERVYIECAILMGSDALEDCGKLGWNL